MPLACILQLDGSFGIRASNLPESPKAQVLMFVVIPSTLNSASLLGLSAHLFLVVGTHLMHQWIMDHSVKTRGVGVDH